MSLNAPRELVAAGLIRERARAGLSLSETARRAGIAKSTLSQLESGVGNPSVETLWAICTALEISFSRLVDPPQVRSQVIRAGQGSRFSADGADYVATLLAVCPPRARRDIFLIAAEPGSAKASDLHPSGTIEHVVISSGSALVGPAAAPVKLQPGDYISYAGDELHVFEALEPGTSAVLISESV
ncbi:helix-turn-helix domain-containing protein [Renibacterium salmoninarum]|uniref:helix-turn-helix domain-containing protein n=1 Tax=Renibacterium salmoninarum TaxID=1646 RepID=UPI0002E53C9B|nr:XRE family transcriptional regulator [Renibacterium salmoninarum]